MCLIDLKINEMGTIHSVIGNKHLSKRLSSLGCIKGTKIKIKTIAPLGDPLIINLRGFDLAIRKKDARNILVETEKENKYENNSPTR